MNLTFTMKKANIMSKFVGALFEKHPENIKKSTQTLIKDLTIFKKR